MSQRHPSEAEYAELLAGVQLDGPFDLGASPAVALFGAVGVPRGRFAVCLRCGAMVVLNDPEEQDDGGPPVERGVRLHAAWHRDVEDQP